MAVKRLTNIDMNSNKVTNLTAGSSSGDAVNFTQLSTKLTASGTTTVTVSTSAPGSPTVGDLWVDTN